MDIAALLLCGGSVPTAININQTIMDKNKDDLTSKNMKELLKVIMELNLLCNQLGKLGWEVEMPQIDALVDVLLKTLGFPEDNVMDQIDKYEDWDCRPETFCTDHLTDKIYGLGFMGEAVTDESVAEVYRFLLEELSKIKN